MPVDLNNPDTLTDRLRRSLRLADVCCRCCGEGWQDRLAAQIANIMTSEQTGNWTAPN